MDLFLEIILHIILEPVVEILVTPAADGAEEYLKRSRLPKWLRIVFVVLITVCLIGMLLCIILGTIFLIIAETEEEKPIYLGVLLSGLAMLAVYVTIVVIRLNMKKRRKRAVRQADENTRPDRTALRRIVHVIVDRPIGSVHPEHSDIVYGVNYGFVPDAIGGDGEAQDAYVLGIDKPIEEADGIVIAVIHRFDDAEDKWVVAPSGCEFSDEEIIEKTEFREKFFKTELIR